MSANNRDSLHFFQEMTPKISKKNLLPDRSLTSVWHPCTQMKHQQPFDLLAINKAKGPWLIDQKGKYYFDAISSWWVTLFGHGYEPIVNAIAQQAATLDHVLLAGCTHEPAVMLAERLIQLAPSASDPEKKLSHCLFSSDGASAVEIALKLAIHYWRNVGKPQKKRLVKLQGSYHGETSGALSVTDIALFRNAYDALLVDSETIPVPDIALSSTSKESEKQVDEKIRNVAALFEEKAEQLAAVIVEPLIQCATGMRFYEKTFLTRLRALCDKHQVLLIADEIAVGMGRTGTLFACEQAHMAPDILCLSKGLSGGTLPLSVTLASKEIYDAFYDEKIDHAFLHSHSYTGNPIACRAAVTVRDCLEKNNQLDANRITAQKMTEALTEIAQSDLIEHFRHLGMIWAFDVKTEDPAFSKRFAKLALTQGLLLRPIGKTVYLMPPYLIDDSHIRHVSEGLKNTLLTFRLC